MFYILHNEHYYYFDTIEDAISKANELASENNVIRIIATESNNECYSVGGVTPEE